MCMYDTINQLCTRTHAERYKRRCVAHMEGEGEGGTVAQGDAGLELDDDNPLPGRIDPITLGPVVTPALSPYGELLV